ncbi:hypothetical protein [Nesterenkonia muleiensis]|uniref:hypothetical protein n=1 Tax=Nesterenkonia muleiensis TaxID=2282648 RepID=UPI000E73264B|nr:hypothetical protein [Nesterenkonia muleiensis]
MNEVRRSRDITVFVSSAKNTLLLIRRNKENRQGRVTRINDADGTSGIANAEPASHGSSNQYPNTVADSAPTEEKPSPSGPREAEHTPKDEQTIADERDRLAEIIAQRIFTYLLVGVFTFVLYAVLAQMTASLDLTPRIIAPQYRADLVLGAMAIVTTAAVALQVMVRVPGITRPRDHEFLARRRIYALVGDIVGIVAGLLTVQGLRLAMNTAPDEGDYTSLFGVLALGGLTIFFAADVSAAGDMKNIRHIVTKVSRNREIARLRALQESLGEGVGKTIGKRWWALHIALVLLVLGLCAGIAWLLTSQSSTTQAQLSAWLMSSSLLILIPVTYGFVCVRSRKPWEATLSSFAAIGLTFVFLSFSTEIPVTLDVPDRQLASLIGTLGVYLSVWIIGFAQAIIPRSAVSRLQYSALEKRVRNLENGNAKQNDKESSSEIRTRLSCGCLLSIVPVVGLIYSYAAMQWYKALPPSEQTEDDQRRFTRLVRWNIIIRVVVVIILITTFIMLSV